MTTYYVRQEDGNDSHDGLTWGSAFGTFREGVEHLRWGDTLVVGPGVYGAQYIEKSGVTIRGEGAIIDPSASLRAIGLHVTGIYNKIEGFTVRDSNEGGISVFGHHVEVTDNIVYGSKKHGIFGSGDYFDFNHNEVYENAAQGATSGISVRPKAVANHNTGYHIEITNNYIHDNRHFVGTMTDNFGVIIDNNPNSGYNFAVLVARNDIRFNGGEGILLFNIRKAVVMENFLYHNSQDAVSDNAGEFEARGSSGIVSRNYFWAELHHKAIVLVGAARNDLEWRYNHTYVDGDPGNHGIRSAGAPHTEPTPALNYLGEQPFATVPDVFDFL